MDNFSSSTKRLLLFLDNILITFLALNIDNILLSLLLIDAMEKLLAEEYARKEKIIAYENSKAEVIKNSLLK